MRQWNAANWNPNLAEPGDLYQDNEGNWWVRLVPPNNWMRCDTTSPYVDSDGKRWVLQDDRLAWVIPGPVLHDNTYGGW